MSTPTHNADPSISLVVPVFNEQRNVPPLLDRARLVLDATGLRYELLFVDDGSTDGTAAEIRALADDDTRIRLLQLSRNFGHQAALVAGLEHARGEAVITMDGDLQHPPELISELVSKWRAGYEVVQAIRRAPADTNPLKRTSSRWFYRLLSWLTRLEVTPGSADFRLLARPAVDALLDCGERCRFNRGLVHWIGFHRAEVPYDAAPRHTGRSKYSLRAMLRLAGDAIFSFTSWPLRLAGLAGALIAIPAGLYLLYVLWARLFTERTEPGWSSILATVLILGGVNLIVLWILGEYVGRMYEEVKQRPIYIVRPTAAGTAKDTRTAGSADADSGGPSPADSAQTATSSDVHED